MSCRRAHVGRRQLDISQFRGYLYGLSCGVSVRYRHLQCRVREWPGFVGRPAFLAQRPCYSFGDPAVSKLCLMLISTLLLLSLCGCGKRVAGRYMTQGDTKSYLQLERDGTFLAEVSGAKFNGTYYLVGDTITFRVGTGVKVQEDRGTIRGNTIADSDGVLWAKLP